jgi:hypothetical protein
VVETGIFLGQIVFSYLFFMSSSSTVETDDLAHEDMDIVPEIHNPRSVMTLSFQRLG